MSLVDLREVIEASPNSKDYGKYRQDHCVFHSPDHNPSMLIWASHVECRACGASMSAREYMDHIGERSETPALPRPETTSRPVKPPKVPADHPIESVVVRALEFGMTDYARDWLGSRGIRPPMIERWHLGYDGARDAVTIPVIEDGEVWNIRLRSISRSAKNKFGNWTEKLGETVYSWGQPSRLFNGDALRHASDVIVSEGELHCIPTQEITGMPCVSGTTGAGGFSPLWLPRFDTCQVIYLVPDLDTPGLLGMIRIAQALGPRRCYLVPLPESLGRGGDLIDYWTSGFQRIDFVQLLGSAVRMDTLTPDHRLCRRYRDLIDAPSLKRQ